MRLRNEESTINNSISGMGSFTGLQLEKRAVEGYYSRTPFFQTIYSRLHDDRIFRERCSQWVWWFFKFILCITWTEWNALMGACMMCRLCLQLPKRCSSSQTEIRGSRQKHQAEQEANSRTVNEEFVQRVVPDNFSDLKSGENMVVKTLRNIEQSEKMFVT